MRTKIIFLFATLAFCSVAKSQFLQEERSFFLSGAALYDWQIMKGGPTDFGYASSVGVRGMLEGEINDLWSYRMQASIPGLYAVDKGYDRRGLGGFDILFNASNLFVQHDRSNQNNFYAALGCGVVVGSHSLRQPEGHLLSFYGTAGLGYNYFIWKKVGIFAEADFTYYTYDSDVSATLAVGLRFKIK